MVRRALTHLILLAGAAVMLAPFVIMLSISLKPPGEVFSPQFSLLPTQWHAVENYTGAFTKVPRARFLANALFVTLCIFAAQAVTALPMAYALVRVSDEAVIVHSHDYLDQTGHFDL